MKHLYRVWIQEYEARCGALLGRCAKATGEMVCVFPELRRASGYALTLWGRRAHWWCVAPDGEIIDPTENQFPLPVAEYIEWRPGDEVCVGKCMNCGEEIWRAVQSLDGERATICGEMCRAVLDREFNVRARRPPMALDVLEEPLA